MKILTIIGARPQFIKAAAMSQAIRQMNAEGAEIEEKLIHTGQHYDSGMSDIFFDELEIPAPAYHLGIGSASHGVQTGRMMEELDKIFLDEQYHQLLYNSMVWASSDQARHWAEANRRQAVK